MITLLQEKLNILPYEIVCDIMYKYKGLRHPIATALKNEDVKLKPTIRACLEYKKLLTIKEREECINWDIEVYWYIEDKDFEINTDIGFFDCRVTIGDWSELENRFPKVLLYHFFSNFYYLKDCSIISFEANEIKKYWKNKIK